MKKICFLVVLTFALTTFLNANKFVSDVNDVYKSDTFSSITILSASMTGIPARISLKKEFIKSFSFDNTVLKASTEDLKGNKEDVVVATEAMTFVSVSDKVDKKTGAVSSNVTIFLGRGQFNSELAKFIETEYKNCVSIALPNAMPMKVENIQSLKFDNSLITLVVGDTTFYSSLEGLSYVTKKTKNAKGVETSTLGFVAAGAVRSTGLGNIARDQIASGNIKTVMQIPMSPFTPPFNAEKVDSVSCDNNFLGVKVPKGFRHQNFDGVRTIIIKGSTMTVVAQ